MKSFLAPGVAALLIISAGFVNAYWRGVFGGVDDQEVLREFAVRLQEVPLEIGDWEGTDEEEMDRARTPSR